MREETEINAFYGYRAVGGKLWRCGLSGLRMATSLDRGEVQEGFSL